MTITRAIRTPIMHRVVRTGDLVFIGGTIADDTSVSMGAQTANILGKIEGYLKESGSDRHHVLSASIFVTDLAKKKEMDGARTAFFGEALPTRATVDVADLGGGALIEVVVTARVVGLTVSAATRRVGAAFASVNGVTRGRGSAPPDGPTWLPPP